ncbi:hypothetical protein HJG53_04250 [Sphingomonas sp. ID1715]|uniref:dipeptidyl-peptidase 3 family protein n=1 Tax=Sphingomonas sp. ID1715 TaxID=1656898 RepID=UPI001487F2E8|nr:hypothetical protein [Sphingomonas sp. ID1715]NNM76120.1 hypothetical protein [Sphingomonas sp. ID1715]
MRNILLASVLLATVAAPTAAAEPAYDLAASRAKIAKIEMKPDTSYLTAEERQVVNLLIDAANKMSAIYLRQNYAANPEVRRAISVSRRADQAQLLDMFDLYFGPWDELADGHPFWGSKMKPSGAGFYPEDLTKEQFEAYLAAHPDEKPALIGPYTVVRREGAKLVAVPYSKAYAEWLEPAAQDLEKAAAITTNPSLKRFLTLRAKAFRTDDYYESELAWMDLKDTPIEVAIGPYETYTDELYGAKTAFEAFVTLRNPKASAALDKYKRYLRDMEANLPVEEKYKNFQRGFESPIAVVDQVHGGGDNVPGVQTVAFNLPNDERVREAKGAKKVILANVLGAKYERILKPMAALVLVPDQARLVTDKYMENETLFHELSHSLGPGTIVKDGRKTSVDKELKELASGLEEAKADVMGAWNILFMMDKGELPANERSQLKATYVAGLFRAMRFGIGEAHGKGAAAQYRFLREHGAITWDAGARRFRVDETKIKDGIAALVAAIVKLQGDGDYEGVKAFYAKYAVLDPEAQAVIATMSNIPVDIQPIYPEKL